MRQEQAGQQQAAFNKENEPATAPKNPAEIAQSGKCRTIGRGREIVRVAA